MNTMIRVVVYVDGFNLYFGLKDKNWKKYYWLNIKALAQSLLKKNQVLVETKYFTSHIKKPKDKVKRQKTFLEALATLDEFKIFYGKYQINIQICPQCNLRSPVPHEKMTDVNIAVEMLKDAYQDKYDTAILISADSDLKGPIQAIRELFPQKQIILAFPPERSSYELQEIAHDYFQIFENKFKKSQFPDEVRKPDGIVLKRPDRWR